jgi:hypothetical protein
VTFSWETSILINKRVLLLKEDRGVKNAARSRNDGERQSQEVVVCDFPFLKCPSTSTAVESGTCEIALYLSNKPHCFFS